MMKNLFDIFREKLAAKEYTGKEKYWKELEQKLNANDGAKGGGFFPTGMVFSVLIGLGAFVLLFPIFMKDKTEQYFNPFNSNTKQVIAQNETKIEDKSQKSIPENTQIAKTNIVAENSEVIAPNNTAIKYYNNKNASFIRLANPVSSSALTLIEEETGISEEQFSNLQNSNAANTLSFAAPFSDVISTSQAAQTLASYSASTGLMPNSNFTLLGISSLPLMMLNPGDASYSLLPFKKELPDYFHNPSFTYKVGVYAGVQYSKPVFNDTYSNNVSFAERVKKEEKGTLTPLVGIDFQLSKNGWTISSGINYFQQGEQRNYTDNFIQTSGKDSLFYSPVNKTILEFDTTIIPIIQQQNVWVMTDTVVTYYNELTGTFVTATVPMMVMVSNGTDTSYSAVVDTNFVMLQDSIQNGIWVSRDFRGANEAYRSLLKGKNTFSYIEIPLLIGYDWRVRNISLGLKGGIGLGMLTQQTAYYLSSDERKIQPYLIEENKKMIYNIIVRPSFGYWFGNHWGLECSPTWRMNLNNLKQNPSQRNSYRSFGLQAGFSYRW
jgi:hypothetical protein